LVLARKGLHQRAAYFRCVRAFFVAQGFLEVDTPIRQPVIIPESNIEPFGSEGWFLQSSPELFMKRLLAAQDCDIFQICHCFRRGEKGRRHLEEFMMLEWYRRDTDYEQLMVDCRDLFLCLQSELRPIFANVGGQDENGFWELPLDLAWERLSVHEAFSRYSPLGLDAAIEGDTFEELLVEFVEPNLGRFLPTFLVDYPVSMASLARKKESEPLLAERFELYFHGVELANGFSELTDVSEQRMRFVEELARIKKHSSRVTEMPERFLADLSLLPSAAGIALGLDRLFMMLGGYQEINEAVTFSPEDFL